MCDSGAKQPYVIIAGPDDTSQVRHGYRLEEHWLCEGSIGGFFLFRVPDKIDIDSQNIRVEPEGRSVEYPQETHLPDKLNIIASFNKAEAFDICSRLMSECFVFLSPSEQEFPAAGLMMTASDWKNIRSTLKAKSNPPKPVVESDSTSVNFPTLKKRVRALLINAPVKSAPDKKPIASFITGVVDGQHLTNWKSQLYRVGAWQNEIWSLCKQQVSDAELEPQQYQPLHDPKNPFESFDSNRNNFSLRSKRFLLMSHFYNYWKHAKTSLNLQSRTVARHLGMAVQSKSTFGNERGAAICDAPSISLAKKEYKSLAAQARLHFRKNREHETSIYQEGWGLGPLVNVLLSVLLPTEFGNEIESAVGKPMWDCAAPVRTKIARSAALEISVMAQSTSSKRRGKKIGTANEVINSKWANHSF